MRRLEEIMELRNEATFILIEGGEGERSREVLGGQVLKMQMGEKA